MVKFSCPLCRMERKAEMVLERKPVKEESRILVYLRCSSCGRVARYSIPLSDYQLLLSEVLQ